MVSREVIIDESENSRLPSGLPAASLIVCSRNRPEMLAETVASILQGNDIPSELIIIDQSNIPHPDLSTLASDRACEIRYLWTRSVGLSRANNAGISAARHNILAFTHDDVLVTPAWFGSIVRALLDAGKYGVVTGRVLPTEAATPGGFALSTKISMAPAVYQGRIGEDVLYPMNMAMYRSAIDEVGGFDTRLGPGTPFPAAEDNDLGFRLLEAGYRISYVPGAVLYHLAWRSENDCLALRWSYARGQGAYYAKFLSLRDRYMMWRMITSIRNKAFGFALQAPRYPRRAYGEAVYLLGLLSGAAQWLLTQRKARQHAP